MNLILLEPEDFAAGGTHVRLYGRRADHVRDVHRARVGDTRPAGILGGRIGTATVVDVGADTVELAVVLSEDPPPAAAVTLVIALPRPKVLRRVLRCVATMGVKRLFLVNAWRVEKSYWATPALAPASVREDFLLGLEQAGDTILPIVETRPRLRPFVEDELAAIIAGTRAFVGTGDAATRCPHGIAEPVTLVVGPDGGFNRFEIGLFEAAGCAPVTLGPRALRVEQAVPAFLGRLGV